MRRLASKFLFGFAVFATAIGASGTALSESKEIVIHNFVKVVGTMPLTGLVVDGPSGALYGFTSLVSGNTHGVVYQLLPPIGTRSMWSYRIIYHNFNNSDLFIIGHVYAGNGIVYCYGYSKSSSTAEFVSLTPPASGLGEWTPTVLYKFNNSGYVLVPSGPLTMDGNGAFYGASNYGGINCPHVGCGAVFKLAPPSTQGQPWSFTVLYRFTGGEDGRSPAEGVILDKQGNLYGSAEGDTGSPLIFKLAPTAGSGEWTQSVIYRFPSSTHKNCNSGGPLAIDADGKLYGVFSIDVSFTGSCPWRTDEYVFQLTPSTSDPNFWTRTFVHVFTYSNPADVGGFRLNAPVTVDAAGNVYGATMTGGLANAGTIFVLRPRPGVPGKWNLKTLFDFPTVVGAAPGSNATGALPNGGLVFDSAGYIYGTTSEGGSSGGGVVFRLKQ